jgi:hypothetical protein
MKSCKKKHLEAMKQFYVKITQSAWWLPNIFVQKSHETLGRHQTFFQKRIRKEAFGDCYAFICKNNSEKKANKHFCVRIIKKCMVATSHSMRNDKQQVPSGHTTLQLNELERSA